MLLQECYEALGGDYEAVKQRLFQDELITKFVLKFLDEPTYLNLQEALKNGNYEDAFRAAHSLKGVCQNLGFDKLAVSSSDLTECLRCRSEKTPDLAQCKTLFEQVEADYQVVINTILKYKKGME